MRLGIHLANYGPATTPSSILRLARAADELGFDSVWVSDHVVIPCESQSVYPYPGTVFTPDTAETFYEPLATLAFIAGATQRVRLGTSILVVPQRNPLVVAKQVATLGAPSGGRVELGVGAGWLAEEFDALGASFADRGPVLEEYLHIFKQVWSEREPHLAGKFYRFPAIRFGPKPVQGRGLPITVGGHSPASLRRAATIADGWHAFRLGHEDLVAPIAALRLYAEQVGRDFTTLHVLLRCSVEVADQRPDRSPSPWELIGEAEEIAIAMRRYQDLGVTSLILTPAPGKALDAALKTMERLATEVFPLVDSYARPHAAATIPFSRPS
jgi:probable F420-dependent oxidoreductase